MEYTHRVMNTHVDSIHPTSGSVGGGTLVTVRGSGFSMGEFCKFGDIEVPVIYCSLIMLLVTLHKSWNQGLLLWK